MLMAIDFTSDKRWEKEEKIKGAIRQSCLVFWFNMVVNSFKQITCTLNKWSDLHGAPTPTRPNLSSGFFLNHKWDCNKYVNISTHRQVLIRFTNYTDNERFTRNEPCSDSWCEYSTWAYLIFSMHLEGSYLWYT